MKNLLITLCLTPLLYGVEYAPSKPNPTEIRIVPVDPTPEPDNVQTTIVFPRRGEMMSQSPSPVQIRLDGYPVGTESDFERKNQLRVDPYGQSMRVIVDNLAPFNIYVSLNDSLDQNNLYYKLMLTQAIPYTLSSGAHSIRAFPVRSYGESLKQGEVFDAVLFYINTKKGSPEFNLKAPYLTYNEPLEGVSYQEGQPILLDFFLSNVELSNDGYKIRVTIDGTIQRILTSWIPYYIEGLSAGKHTLRLELLDEKNRPQPGLFNNTQKTIHIE